MKNQLTSILVVLAGALAASTTFCVSMSADDDRSNSVEVAGVGPTSFAGSLHLGITEPEAAKRSEPQRLIFDTDIGNDVDDVLALGMLHALESRGHCRLLAVTVTKSNPLAARFTAAVNQFYGRPEIPVGIVQNGVTPAVGKYLPLAEARDNGVLRYPGPLSAGEPIPDASRVLRKTLAGEPDGSVVIVQVGFATNLARLLDTPADDISPLAGRELVQRKVRLVSAMFGAFEPISGGEHREYNVVEDLSASRKFVAEWPTPIVFSGFEIGLAINYPADSIIHDYGYVARHPLAESYYLYEPPPHERPCWDLTSVLYAALPDRGYFGVSEPGTVEVTEQGITRHSRSANGLHRYLQLNAEQRTRVREACVQLSSQPVARK